MKGQPMKSGKAQPTRVVPDNKRQDADLIPSKSFGAIPSNRGPATSPHGSPPAPLDPISNADRGADDRA
jgi:hypothetical protein